MIAVTFALPNESSDFRQRLRKPDCSYATEVRVVHTGVGEVAAQKSLLNFFAKGSPRILISAGYAGAISEKLNVGDILLAENFSAAPLLESARPLGTIGRLKTVSEVIDDAGARAAIARDSGAIAIDMETEFIARVCAERNVPMLSLRAISDTPQAPFSLPLLVLFDMKRQRTNLAGLFGYLVRHPSSAKHLLRIAGQTKTARRSLTNALDSFLRDAI